MPQGKEKKKGKPMFSILLSVVSFLIALTIHEFAHALVADRFGDPNPKIAGRLSLNPLVHLDPIGTVALPLFLILSRSPVVFGWAKPVMVDPFNFKNRRKDLGIVSLAGPGANFLLATILSLILRLPALSLSLIGSTLSLFIFSLIVTNLSLGVFNLLPINPLDGGKVLTGFLPNHQAYKVEEFLNRYGQIILLFLIFPFFGRSLLSSILSPVIGFLLKLLLPPLSIV